MNGGIDLVTARDFAIALLIGALVGIEREKHKAEEKASGTPGLRTFILLAECGAVAAWLARGLGSPWLLAAALLAASLLLAAAGLRGEPGRAGTGMTTESAALAVFLLGGLAVAGSPALAAALGIATSALLAYKQPLHRVVTGIGTADFYAALRLLIATFIVLPLLPDRAVDPWGALNPARLWLLVIVISALSFAGYLATRRLGPGRGAAATGAVGGLVSSTAVTLAFSRRSREEPGPAAADALACGIVLSWAVMFVRVVVMVLVVYAPLARPLLLPFSLMGLASGAAALALYRRAGTGGGGEVPLRSPFSLREAVKFALFFAAVLLGVALAGRHFPGRGELAVAALAGLTDVDAITLSMADHARRETSPGLAVAAIAVAALSNTIVKSLMAAFLGTAALRRRVLASGAAILLAGGVALLAAR
jgi:uncharacterized membrane protein (DUF4010 family)